MRSRNFLLLFLIIVGISGGLFADGDADSQPTKGRFPGPLFCPSAGVDVDIAVSVPAIWFGTINMPVIWKNQGQLGFSVVPSFSFGGTGVHGYIIAESLLVFSLSRSRPIDIILGVGVGAGGYYHDELGEFTPVFDCSVSFLFNRIYLRLAGVGVFKFKYYRDIDSSVSVTIGYGLGNRNR